MKFHKIYVLLFVLAQWVPSSGYAEPVELPVVVPIAVNEAGKTIDMTLRLVEERSYRFFLRFHFMDEEDRKKVKQLLGGYARDKNGNYVPPGVVIPLEFEIVSAEPPYAVVYPKQELQLSGIWSIGFSQRFGSTGDFSRLISYVRLRPGVYQIRAKTLSEIPDLKGIPVTFEVSFNPKNK